MLRARVSAAIVTGCLLVWGAVLWIRWKGARDKEQGANGKLFRLFMAGYLAMRFVIEFIKPTYRPYIGLSAIQLTCAGGFAVCVWQLKQHEKFRLARAMNVAEVA